MGDDDLVQLLYRPPLDDALVACCAVDGLEDHHAVVQDGQEGVGILARAGEWNCGGFEALVNEGDGLGVVQPVEALDDAGLDGPAPVQRRQAVVRDAGPSVEPLLAQVVILGEVAVGLRLEWGDGMLGSGSHDDVPETTGAFGSRTSQNADGSGWLSKVGGLSSFWHGGFVHTHWTVGGADVAEATFLP